MATLDPTKSAVPPKFSGNCRDMTGFVVGRLTVLEFAGRDRGGNIVWKCRCECGNISMVSTARLREKQTFSCGCYIKDVTSERSITHGRAHTPECEAWRQMKQRCLNKKGRFYRNYGGRGISICQQWMNSFEAFYADMGPRPSKRHSLDRIDNDGNYEPKNCRWATKKQQSRNVRTNAKITHDGQTLTIVEWSEKTGIPYSRIRNRHKKGLPAHLALSPLDLRRKNQT